MQGGARFTIKLARQVEEFFTELDTQQQLRFFQLMDAVRAIAFTRLGRPQIEQHRGGLWVVYRVSGNEIHVVVAGLEANYPRIM